MRFYIGIILVIFLWSISSISNAQDSIKEKSNVNIQPAWGPTGYDYVEYYYLPDIDVYYYVPQGNYYYESRGHWFSSSYLPARYSSYDIFLSYKVVINEHNPWENDKSFREEYSSYKNRNSQQMIEDSKDVKYFQNIYHPEYKNWIKLHQTEHDVKIQISNEELNVNNKQKK